MRNLQKTREFWKIMLLGDTGVGKTALLDRFAENKFSGVYKRTIGADFKTREITIDDYEYTLQIWDTAGEDRFSSMGWSFWTATEVGILAYSVDNQASFNNIKKWRDKLYEQCPNKPPIVLVGLKSDLPKVITEEQRDALAKELGASYYECSAKTLDGVYEVFSGAIRAKFPERNPILAKLQALENENKDLKEKLILQECKFFTASLQKDPNAVKQVTKIQSFFRRAKAQKDYPQKIDDIKKQIKNINEEAQLIITNSMKEGEYKKVQPLFDAVADKKWGKALEIIEEFKKKEAIQAPVQPDEKPVNKGKMEM